MASLYNMINRSKCTLTRMKSFHKILLNPKINYCIEHSLQFYLWINWACCFNSPSALSMSLNNKLSTLVTRYSFYSNLVLLSSCSMVRTFPSRGTKFLMEINSIISQSVKIIMATISFKWSFHWLKPKCSSTTSCNSLLIDKLIPDNQQSTWTAFTTIYQQWAMYISWTDNYCWQVPVMPYPVDTKTLLSESIQQYPYHFSMDDLQYLYLVEQYSINEQRD